MSKDKKVIVVMGAGISSLGKGIAAASISKLLQDQGLNICNKKVDPYLQVECDTISPLQHGECYVTEDGTTIDQDFGSYYRFAEQKLTKNESITSGRMFSDMLEKEKNGEFLGQTVQLSPHYTTYINDKILNVSEDTDIIIEEIGGIIDDPEANTFIEAARQLKRRIGKENVIFVLLTLVPYLKPTNETKTKLCQTGVKQLRSFGIEPDFLICRTEKKLSIETKNKIALMCDLDESSIIEGIDISSIYKMPIKFKEQKFDKKICDLFKLKYEDIKPIKWKQLIHNMNHSINEKTIAVVGKYTSNPDSYASVIESLKIAGIHLNSKINIKLIDTQELEDYIKEINIKVTQSHEGLLSLGEYFFKDVDGVVIPGGFGKARTIGMVSTANYCRKNNIPCLGICLGMQIMAIEFAINVLGYLDATSEEFDEENSSKNHIIHLMESQKNLVQMSGTMRLGNYKCNIVNKNSNTYKCYNSETIERRHRHRYEFNDIYRKEFSDNGMDIVGINPDNDLVEIIELKNHPFYVGVQYHPEFNTRFIEPEQLFTGLITAALKEK